MALGVLPPNPADEARRLASLRALMVLDSEAEPLFDSIVQMASRACGVPIALISLVDEERQWFKANVGLPGVHETPRDVAFCDHVIRGPEVMEVPDATLDPRFVDNPLVRGRPDIRFYAGAPLALPDGQRIGTLCVIDRRAGALSPEQRAMLGELSRLAVQGLVMRRDLVLRALAVRSDYERSLAESEARYRALVEAQTEMVSLAWPDGELFYVNPAYARQFGLTPEALVGRSLYEYVAEEDREAVRALLGRVLASRQSDTGLNRMRPGDAGSPWVAWTNSAQVDAQGRLFLHSVGRDVSERQRAETHLRENQQLLERMGQMAHVGGWDVDLRTHRVVWTAETRRILGVAPDFVPGLDQSAEFYAPEARDRMRAVIEQAVATGEPWDHLVPVVRQDGQRIWLRAVGEVESEQGRAVRLYGALQDVTERVTTEANLRLLTTIFDHTTDFVVQTDAQGQLTYMNPAARAVSGLGADAPVAHLHFDALHPPATRELYREAIVPAVQAHGVWIGETTVYGPQGREIPVSHMVIAHRDASGTIDRYSVLMRDISVAVDARQALQRQAATLRAVTEAIPAMVGAVGPDERLRFVNSAFERLYQRPREALVGAPLREVLGPEGYAASAPHVARALAGETITFERDFSGPQGIWHLSISYIPQWAEDGRNDGFLTVAQDITHYRREAGRLLELTQRDPLTGLLNRLGFEANLDRAFQAQGGVGWALLYLDLDRFKPVNDEHGHPVGDQLLQQFGQRLSRMVRPTDVVARLGGDEFALALGEIRDGADVRAVADKVLAAARQPFELSVGPVTVGASVGIAYGAEWQGRGWRAMLEAADGRLYAAKRAGRNQAQGG